MLAADRCKRTGWVTHKIVPLKPSLVAGTRATDGLSRVDHRARLQYVGGLQQGDTVFMTNLSDGVYAEFKPRHFWLGQLLPPPRGEDVVFKTRQALPPDVSAGSYCCKIQWFKRTTKDGRLFSLASAQYISLSCIVPANYKIVLSEVGNKLFELDLEVEKKILRTMNGLVIDD